MIPLSDDNPIRIKPVVTVGIIAACVLAFVWQASHDTRAQQAIVYSLGTIPATLLGDAELPPELAIVPPTATILTSMFLHGGWMHLLGNMLYLWIFGNNIEDSMGHARFVVFYVLCGAIAVFAHALPNPASQVPMVGASGAISGVLGAYLLLHPHARVLILIPLGFLSQLVRLKAMWVLGFWFLIQVLNSAMTAPGRGGVAFGAHIGGFVAGMALIPLFKHRDVRLVNPLTDRRR